jgi:hypothetical protein
MRKVIADEWMTLDGIIQAPGRPDEDRTGGFQQPLRLQGAEAEVVDVDLEERARHPQTGQIQARLTP